MQKIKKLKTYNLAATALLVAISIVLGQFKLYIPLFGYPSVRFTLSGIPIVIVGILFGSIYGGAAGFLSDIISFLFTAGGGAPYHPGFTLNMMIAGILPGLLFRLYRKKQLNLSFNKINSGISLMTLMLTLVYINKIGISEVETMKSFMNLPMNIILSILMVGIVVVLNVAGYQLQKNMKDSKEHLYSIDKIFTIEILIYLLVHLGLTPIWLNQMYGIPIIASVWIRIFKALVDVPLHAVLLYGVLKIIPANIKERCVE